MDFRVNKKEMKERGVAKREKDARRDAAKSKAKLLIGGFVLGVVSTVVVGFSTGNFIIPSHAARMAQEAAYDARLAALVPYCVANFNESADAEKNLAALLETSKWMRSAFISDGEWAGDGAGSRLNRACAEMLVTEASEATEKGA